MKAICNGGFAASWGGARNMSAGCQESLCHPAVLSPPPGPGCCPTLAWAEQGGQGFPEHWPYGSPWEALHFDSLHDAGGCLGQNLCSDAYLLSSKTVLN